MTDTPRLISVDTLIYGVTLVTMDDDRRIITDAAVTVIGDRIAHVGKTSEIRPMVMPREVVDGSRFVMTPGFINGHIHITGEPITRGYVPDDSGWQENVWEWLVPLYQSQTPEEEGIAASLAALEMLRTGTTCFLEGGTVRFLEPVAEALEASGIRGRIGLWTEDRAFDPAEDQTMKTDAAIRAMEAAVASLPQGAESRIGAWPLLVGHVTGTDALWQAASALAKEKGCVVAAHMSPVEADPEWYLANLGRRPVMHLAHLGVLGQHISLTHAVHLDGDEVAALAAAGASVTHCPMSALKGAYGAGPAGQFPEMHAAGVNLMLGTDGNNNSNTSDLMRASYLVAALFKDARRNTGIFPANEALTMITRNGAKGMGMDALIGSIKPGKKADFVLHDTDRPEWRPLLNVVNQLIWSADGRGVHSVWVDGRRVVDNYRSTLIDEERLYAEVERAGGNLIARTGLPDKQCWPVV